MTIITRRRASLALALCLAAPAAALELPLPPGAQVTTEDTEPSGSYRLPTAPWTRDAGLPTTRIDGRITRRAWRIPGRRLSPAQILTPIRETLEREGWDIVLDCDSDGCGGFDFRFGTEVLPAPDMYVDLTNFRALSARGPQDEAGLSVLVSRSDGTSYVQVIEAMPGDADAADAIETTPQSVRTAPERGSLIDRLERNGHAILSDLDFASGVSALADGPIASLDAIAAFLRDNPDRRILFVGHTDATGSLAANRDLSKRRADTAVRYLRSRHNIGGKRVSSEGAGYLAPVASNLTEEGRVQNRRVEAVLLPGG